ncbi:hypothetical protein COLO4_35114 [Corchorus olitorius]|uniref:Uncharacterized protein n=1 Tax=Corchorus olitorius TaxID=93759 RepID=A0A1R3GI47_9ROSI|nr:hypothetical protein COLO4_35114 [Corchorus olitorius]
MASILGSQGVVLATAMAVSGTVILLAFRLQKSLPLDHQPSQQALRSCISSEDVRDPRTDGEEFRRQLRVRMKINSSSSATSSSSSSSALNSSPKFKKMPGNRVALYNGILRDRVVQRLAYSC